MAVDRRKANVGYGLTNALQDLAPQPIISTRNPSTKDHAEIGTLWINKNTDAYYIATSTSAGATNWEAQSTGSGTFAAVTVTGAVGDTLQVTADSVLSGTLDVGGDTSIAGDLAVTGDVSITGDFDITDVDSISLTSTNNAAKAIYLHANGGVTETIEIHSDQGTGLNSVYIYSDVGGILVESTGKVNNKAVNLVADAGGFQLDGVLTSALNVVGAGEDIQLNSTGGSIHITATEASSTAINLSASDAAGKVAITGVGGITIATTNTTASLSTGTGAINLGTDAVAKAIAIGNHTGATTVAIEAGTAAAGSIHIGQSANAVPIVIGNVTGATGVTINSGTNGIAMASTGAGDITLASSDTCLIDAAGVLELNSSAGVISIGNDAVSQNMNVGTAGVRILQVGSSTGASGIAVHSGTAGCTFGTDANEHSTTIGSITTASATTIQSGTGGVTITGTNGIITANSGTGAVIISGDAAATVVGLGTGAAAKTVTVGSTTAGSTLALNTPTGTAVTAPSGLTIATAAAKLTLPGPVHIMTGAGVPANGLALNVGDMYIRTDAGAAAERIYIATAASTWTNVSCAA